MVYIIDVALTDELNSAALSYVDPQVVSVSTAVLYKQFHTHCGIRGYMNRGVFIITFIAKFVCVGATVACNRYLDDYC